MFSVNSKGIAQLIVWNAQGKITRVYCGPIAIKKWNQFFKTLNLN
jgi:hypothetical protein